WRGSASGSLSKPEGVFEGRPAGFGSRGFFYGNTSMRVHVLVLLTVLAIPSTATAQNPNSASPEAQRANQHYKKGWEAMRAEAWAEAAREFQQAIDNDPKFTLAYYSLGRAEMSLRDFPKAIDAYLKCRELYVAFGGERFTNQFEATRRIDDRILELRTALNQANQRGGV